MANFKMYEMIIETREHTFKAHSTAKSVKDLKERYSGNGDFVRIKEVTEDFAISEDKVFRALKNAEFGDVEAEAVVAMLRRHYSNVVQ